MPADLQVVDELTVPEGWEITPAGMSCSGLHALDVRAGLDHDGLIVFADKPIELPDEMWGGSYAEWVCYTLIDVVNFSSEQGRLLRQLLEELDGLRPDPEFDLHT